MGSVFTFYDYADESGINIINDWLNGAGKEAKAYFNSTIRRLEESLLTGSQDSVWRRPVTRPLRREWGGFIELRKKAKGVQHRLICKIEGRNVLLVTWGYHKGRWGADITSQKAKDRVEQMKNNLARYGREHDNS